MAALIKSRSDIWKYFTLSDDKKETKCKLCNATQKYHGGTSSMNNHLKYKHKTSADTLTKSPATIKLQVGPT